MNIALVFALSSLVFGGLIDTSYKLYSRKPRSRGVFLAGMGVVWLGLQLPFFAIMGQALVLDGPTWAYGLAAGLTLTFSNLMFIECMTRLNVSLGSTIYRLNTIGVVVLSFLLLAEPLPLVKQLGIASGIVAVLFLYERSADATTVRLSLLYLGIAIFASCFRASYGVITKAGLLAGADVSGLLVIAALCWMIGGLTYGFWRERPMRLTREMAGYALVAGFLAFGTVNTLILGLKFGEATVVIPIANLGFVIALALGVAWKMERFTMRKGVAVGFATLAIFFLSRLA